MSKVFFGTDLSTLEKVEIDNRPLWLILISENRTQLDRVFSENTQSLLDLPELCFFSLKSAEWHGYGTLVLKRTSDTLILYATPHHYSKGEVYAQYSI